MLTFLKCSACSAIFSSSQQKACGSMSPDFRRRLISRRIVRRTSRGWYVNEVEKWKVALNRVQLTDPEVPVASRGETELRLMIGETEARLQWRRPGYENFEPIKPGQATQLLEDERRGWIQFAPESALLWQVLSARFFYAPNYQLRYFDDDALNAKTESMPAGGGAGGLGKATTSTQSVGKPANPS